jgi:ankyrin repeat protein
VVIESIAQLLVECGADVNATSASLSHQLLSVFRCHEHDTFVHILTCIGGLTPTLLELLCQAGMDINQQNTEGNTVIHALTERRVGYATTMESVLASLAQHGADVNARDALGSTAVLALAASGRLTTGVIEILHKSGADISAKNPDGQTALHIYQARKKDECESVIDSLIQHGVDVDTRDAFGDTALLALAASQGLTTHMIEALYHAGTDMSAVNTQGQTVLHALPQWRGIDYRNDVITSLLQHGVDINARDALGDTLLHILAKCGSYGSILPEIIATLHSAGANMSAVNTHGQTVLHVLNVLHDDDREAAMAALIQHGVDVNTRDNNCKIATCRGRYVSSGHTRTDSTAC